MQNKRRELTILVVDDEPEFRLLMKSILSLDGHLVMMAEDGEDAIEKIQKAGSVDIIISDVYMPIMDGIKLHRTIRSTPQFSTTPFLFVSAFDDQHTLDVVKNPKIEAFVKKGRPVEELKEWIAYMTMPEEHRPKLPPSHRVRRGSP
jgi:CheY-like chemotaxis protein